MIIKKSGFTLLEILVALAVFAILASMTSRVLLQVFDTRERLTHKLEHTNTIQIAMTRIKRDITQIVMRDVRGNEMLLFSAFIGQQNNMEFTRAGRANPNGMYKRSSLERVAYVCKKDKLIRQRWMTLDTPNRKKFHSQILLENLTACSFIYVSKEKQNLSSWEHGNPIPNALFLKATSMPAAIRLIVAQKGQKSTNILFIMPIGLYNHEG